MWRLIIMFFCLTMIGHAQIPPQFSGLISTDTNYAPTWSALYTSNGTGVPGNYFGPPYAGSLVDPIFGTTATMVPTPTNCPGGCGSNTDGYIGGYSKVTLLSQDKKFYVMLDTRGWLYLYDATVTPHTFIRRIQISASTNHYAAEGNDLASDFSDWQWSRLPGTHLIYYIGAGNGAGRDTIKAYNPDTDTASVIWDGSTTMALYPGCTNLDNEREGEYDENDNVFPFICTGSSQGDQYAAVVYTKSTNSVVSKGFGTGGLCAYTTPGTCYTANYITASPSGDYLLIDWNAGSHDSSWVPGTGNDLFQPDLTYLGGVTSNNNHGDIGYDVNGNEVYVQSSDGATNPQLHIFAVAKLSVCTSKTVVGPVASGGCQHFFRMPTAYCWCTGFTISMRATQGSGMGWMLLSDYDSNTTYNNITAPFSTENLILKIDWPNLSDNNTDDQVAGTPNLFFQAGRNESVKAAPSNPDYDGDYYAQPNGTPFMDFSGFSYTTTYDHCNVAPCAIPSSEFPTGYGAYENYYTVLAGGSSVTGTVISGAIVFSGDLTF